MKFAIFLLASFDSFSSLEKETFMRQAFLSTSGFLIAAIALILNISPCTASEISPSLDSQSLYNLKPESEYHKFDVRTSQTFYFFSKKYQGVGCGDRSGIYYPWSVAPVTEYRSLEEKIIDRLLPLLQYPGGTLFCDAVQAGFEFVTYSKEMTTYRYRNFYTRIEFDRTLSGRRNLRTGIFYSF